MRTSTSARRRTHTSVELPSRNKLTLSHRSRVSLRSDEYDFEPDKCNCPKCKLQPHNPEHQHNMRKLQQPDLTEVHELINNQREDAINDLRQLVPFKSISVDPDLLMESVKALEWVQDRLGNLNFHTRMVDIPYPEESCVERIERKVLFANYFSSPMKSTLLIYSHIDVLPTQPDCWLNDPFSVDIRDGNIYGRGVSKGKGMLIGWIQAIECWIKVSDDLPINVRFLVEMSHEVGSIGLQTYVRDRPAFFQDVDYMLFDVNSWLNDSRPVIPCGITGRAYFSLEVRGGNKTVETGTAGGLVFEPLIDLCHLMNQMVDHNQEMTIPQMDSGVKALTTLDWQLLETAEFSSYKYRDTLSIRRLRHEDNNVEMLRSRWCKAALTMHGVDGSDTRSDCSPGIPMMVTGKFSIRLVPDQEVSVVHNAVNEFISHASTELNVSTKLKLSMLDSTEPISWSTSSTVVKAIREAVKGIYQKEPYVTNAIPINLPVANALHKLLKKPMILLPYSKRLDRHQLENENIPEQLFAQHSKLCASVLFELSCIKVRCKCHIINDYCNMKGIADKFGTASQDVERVETKRKTGISFSRLKRKKDANDANAAPKKKLGKTIKEYLRTPFHKINKSKKKAQPPISIKTKHFEN